LPRPNLDGTPARAPRRHKLTDAFVKRLRPEGRAYAVWDTHQKGLCVLMQRTGSASWKVVYTHGRPRWYHVGSTRAVGLSDARKIAAKVMLEVATGRDPVAERKAERGAGTFAELATRYVEHHAKKRNKSWDQADYLVRRHLLPRWGKLDARSITRADVRQAMERITAPITANQTLAAASAIFSWAVKQEVVAANPCRGVDRNPTKDRERVLSDAEVPLFWGAFNSAGLVRSSALKIILLTGQRPGEVSCMCREHIVDGWWQMPGDPDLKLGWPGTKNKQNHRVWLPERARAIIAELTDGGASTGFIFAGPRGRAVDGLDAAMRGISKRLGVEPVRPHDLRRTHGTMITRLGFGRDAMNRIRNHVEGGIASVYDRHQYADENKRIMEAVAARIMALALGEGGADNVVRFRT
jgi:integrase